MVFVFRAKSQNNEKSNTELELFELPNSMLRYSTLPSVKIVATTHRTFLDVDSMVVSWWIGFFALWTFVIGNVTALIARMLLPWSTVGQ